MNQIDIYDLLTPEDLTAVNFHTMSIEEITALLGDRLGLTFKFNGFFNEYQAKVGARVLSVRISHYTAGVNDGAAFLSCGYHDTKGNMEGCGRPCDSLAEAFNFFHRAKEGARV